MKKITVGFYGKYIPLQGVEYIIDAARDPRCEMYTFTLIGNGQTYAKVRTYAKEKEVTNVQFIERMPYAELRRKMAEWDIALGIFGATEKTTRVIPNKVYDAIALGLPVITGDTNAIREIFTDGSDIVLAQVADGADLAEKIQLLAENELLRKRIAHEGRETYERVATPVRIGASLLTFLQSRYTNKSRVELDT